MPRWSFCNPHTKSARHLLPNSQPYPSTRQSKASKSKQFWLAVASDAGEDKKLAVKAPPGCTRRAAAGLIALSAFTLPSLASKTDAAEDTYAIYQQAAGSYDDLDDGFLAYALGFQGLRSSLVSQSSGRVLELAVGTGLNIPSYNTALIDTYTGLDLSPEMLSQARMKLDKTGLKGKSVLVEGNVEALPFPDDSFDTALSTFSLCVFEKPQAALQEMHRVLRPGGKALLLEHSRSKFAPLGWYQDLTASTVTRLSKGCAWNQDVLALVRSSGLQVLHSERHCGGLLSLIVATK